MTRPTENSEGRPMPEIVVIQTVPDYIRLHTIGEAYGLETSAEVFAHGMAFLELLAESQEIREAFVRVANQTGVGNPLEPLEETDNQEDEEDKGEVPTFKTVFRVSNETSVRTLKVKNAFNIDTPEEFLYLSLCAMENLLVAKRTGVSTQVTFEGRSFDLFEVIKNLRYLQDSPNNAS